MAVIPSRRPTLQRVVDSIARQTRRPDLLRIYYSRTRWHLDEGWRSAPRVRADFPVEVREVPNIGSARKYLPTLAEFRGEDVHVVLVDDDLIWAPHVFATLLRHALRTGEVVTTRGWSEQQFITTKSGDVVRRDVPIVGYRASDAREVLVASSGWATLFHVRHVDDRLFDRKIQREYALRYSDEVFLSAMLRCRKLVVPVRGRFCEAAGGREGQWLTPKTSFAKIKQLELFGGRSRSALPRPLAATPPALPTG